MRIVWLSQVSVPITMSGFPISRRAWNWATLLRRLWKFKLMIFSGLLLLRCLHNFFLSFVFLRFFGLEVHCGPLEDTGTDGIIELSLGKSAND